MSRYFAYSAQVSEKYEPITINVNGMKNRIEIKKAIDSCSEYYDKIHLDYFNQYSEELIKKPYDRDFLNRFITSVEKNGRILDIGCCSTAQQARFFHDNGYRVTSIDLSRNCIETAKQRFPQIDFLQLDMTEMTFEENSFDGINAFYSIIHIPDEKLHKLFADFSKLLKVDGKIAISVHAGDFYGYYTENQIPVFYRTYTQEELKHYLDKSGFEIIEINQRPPLYDFEFQSERIYLIARLLPR